MPTPWVFSSLMIIVGKTEPSILDTLEIKTAFNDLIENISK